MKRVRVLNLTLMALLTGAGFLVFSMDNLQVSECSSAELANVLGGDSFCYDWGVNIVNCPAQQVQKACNENKCKVDVGGNATCPVLLGAYVYENSYTTDCLTGFTSKTGCPDFNNVFCEVANKCDQNPNTCALNAQGMLMCNTSVANQAIGAAHNEKHPFGDPCNLGAGLFKQTVPPETQMALRQNGLGNRLF